MIEFEQEFGQVGVFAIFCVEMAGKMEVDSPSGSVMASTSCPGSVSVSLHPLVIMNISEHWTRVRAQEGKPIQGTYMIVREN